MISLGGGVHHVPLATGVDGGQPEPVAGGGGQLGGLVLLLNPAVHLHKVHVSPTLTHAHTDNHAYAETSHHQPLHYHKPAYNCRV